MAEIDVANALKHGFVTGTTGAGKSGYLLGFVLATLTRVTDARVVVVDAKGELGDELAAFLGVMALRGTAPVTPDEVLVVAPFKDATVPSNPLAPTPSLDPATQAVLATRTIKGISAGFGIRMEACFTALAEGVIRAGRGSLADLRRALVEPAYAEAVGQQIRTRPELHEYLAGGLERESKDTRAALVARLDYLLAFPALRAAVCAAGCLEPQDFFRYRLAIVNLGGAPQGNLELARYMGGIYWNLLCGGVFSRTETTPAFVVVDEVQEVVTGDGGDLERLFALARSRRVGLTIACQTQTQLASHATKLLASIRTNAHRRIIFRPAATDLAEVADYVGNPVGRTDAVVSDRRLTAAAERARRLEEWHDLPDREFLHLDRFARTLEHQRTLSLPYAMVQRERGGARAQIDAFARGARGRPWQELEPAPPTVAIAPVVAPASVAPSRPPSPRPAPAPATKRQKLVLP